MRLFTSFLALWLLAACAGDDGTTPPDPVDGLLPAGTWGAEHYALTVDASGAASLEGDCAHGDLGTPTVEDGALLVTFDWVLEGGPVPTTGTIGPATPVTLTASVTEVALDGTLAANDGSWSEELLLGLGDEPMLYKCQ